MRYRSNKLIYKQDNHTRPISCTAHVQVQNRPLEKDLPIPQTNNLNPAARLLHLPVCLLTICRLKEYFLFFRFFTPFQYGVISASSFWDDMLFCFCFWPEKCSPLTQGRNGRNNFTCAFL